MFLTSGCVRYDLTFRASNRRNHKLNCDISQLILIYVYFYVLELLSQIVECHTSAKLVFKIKLINDFHYQSDWVPGSNTAAWLLSTESGSSNRRTVTNDQIIFLWPPQQWNWMKPIQMNLEAFFFVFFFASKMISIESHSFMFYTPPHYYFMWSTHSRCVYSNVVKTQHSRQNNEEQKKSKIAKKMMNKKRRNRREEKQQHSAQHQSNSTRYRNAYNRSFTFETFISFTWLCKWRWTRETHNVWLTMNFIANTHSEQYDPTCTEQHWEFVAAYCHGKARMLLQFLWQINKIHLLRFYF